MKEWENFRTKILKVTKERKHHITRSLGVYDAYKWIRKNHWLNIGRVITEKEFYSIIRKVNEAYIKVLLAGYDVELPLYMGRIELRKSTPTYKMINGKIKTNLSIDWNSTLKLWYQDEKAFQDKTIIRTVVKERFLVRYNKAKAKFNNKAFYDIKFNRDFLMQVKDCVNNYGLDAFNI